MAAPASAEAIRDVNTRCQPAAAGHNIPATADSSIAALPEPFALTAAADAAFIVVPIGAVGGRIRTMGLCNGRTP